MNTLLLNENWDLTADANGNIAVATGGYAIAQDVASAIRTVLGELWYDTTQGVPYFSDIMGRKVSLLMIQNYLNNAALLVPGVVKVQTTLDPLTSNRLLTGSVKVIDTNGQELNVTF